MLKDTQIHILADSDEQEVVQQVQVIVYARCFVLLLDFVLLLIGAFSSLLMDFVIIYALLRFLKIDKIIACLFLIPEYCHDYF